MKELQKKIFEDAWLGLGDLNKIIIPKNPMIHRSEYDIENPDLHLMRILRDPKYLASTCKLLFNIELHPIQAAILQEFWIRPFPMFVASRGFGKMLAGDTPIRVKNGWKPMKDIKTGDYVYGGDGKLTKVTKKTALQKNLKFYKITLRDGRTIRCCEDHLWKVWDKNKNRNIDKPIYTTIATKDLAKNYFWKRIGDKSNGTEYRYALPLNKPLTEEESAELILHPYIVGVLIGDGCLTQKNITFTTLDKEIADKVNKLLPEGYIAKQSKDIKTWRIIRSNKNNPPFYTIIQKLGLFGLYSHNKFIPTEYQYASYDQKLELIKGLMDTDGYSDRSVKEYYTISSQLSNDFLNVARSLGLHCKHGIKEAWFNDTQYSDCYRISIYTNQPIFSLSRKLEYLNYSVSKQGESKYSKVFITKIEEDGYDDGYCISVDNEDKTYLTKDYIVTHNSFLMSLYCILKCTFVPGTKIVVVGAAFRQSKIIFEYMENIWRNSPILRSIFNGNDDGPRRDVDRCTIRLGDSWTVAVPMGDGCLVADSMVTYDNGFGYLGDLFDTAYTKELDTTNNCTIWDNTKFEKSFSKRYNGFKPTIKITSNKGYFLEGTHNHEIKVLDGTNIVWRRLDEIRIEDQILIDSQPRWHNGSNDITVAESYALGLMIGDGSWTNKYRLRFTTQDPELSQAVEQGTGLKFYQCGDKMHYNHDSIKNVTQWKDRWGFGFTYTKDKYLPQNILSGTKEVMSACLRGIFDTDGHVQGSTAKGGMGIIVSLTNTSKKLVDQIHFVLLHYGIVSSIRTRNRNKKWNTIYELLITGHNVKKFNEQIGFGLKRKQEALDFFISKKQRWPSQEKFADGYFVDKIVLIEKSKNFTYDIEVESSHQYNANGLCVHNSKIRGLRAHIIIADEFASISPDIYETVVSGFAAVSASPIQNVKEQAKRKAMADEIGRAHV